jgi:hypothetical protein
MADENEKAALGWSAAGGREFGFDELPTAVRPASGSEDFRRVRRPFSVPRSGNSPVVLGGTLAGRGRVPRGKWGDSKVGKSKVESRRSESRRSESRKSKVRHLDIRTFGPSDLQTFRPSDGALAFPSAYPPSKPTKDRRSLRSAGSILLQRADLPTCRLTDSPVHRSTDSRD